MQMELTASSELLFINTVELAVLANRAEAVPANQVARLWLGQPTLQQRAASRESHNTVPRFRPRRISRILTAARQGIYCTVQP